MSTEKRERKLQESADRIAELVEGVSIDHRGDLFHKVAANLQMKAQGYTASLFREMACLYGLSQESEGADLD